MIRFNYLLLITILIFSCTTDTKETFSTVISPRTKKPISLSKNLTQKSLEFHSFNLDDLRILRNEIYARNGYIFKSEDLNDYFLKYDWYNPRFKSDAIDNYLSEIDKGNIEVIISYEKLLKENKWITKKLEDFTFEDFIDCLPEFSLPLDFDNIEFKDPKDVDRFYDLDYKFKEKHHGYGFKGEPFGKILISDTITALGLVAASDLYVFHYVAIVDNKGNILDYFDIPVSHTNTTDFDETLDEVKGGEDISTFTNTVITSDFKQIATSWEITTIRDTLGNIVKQVYSDTVIGKSEIYEITKFLD